MLNDRIILSDVAIEVLRVEERYGGASEVMLHLRLFKFFKKVKIHFL